MTITLKTLNDHTLLEIFNEVREHLLFQNAKSLAGVNDLLCVYKNPEGLNCAVGCLIPDEDYVLEMDRGTYAFLEKFIGTYYPYIDLKGDRFRLLQNLQTIHDQSSVEEWETELNTLKEHLNICN